MALWKVDDQATRESMGGFYRRQLTGQPVWRAIQEAQREYLTGQRKAGDEPNPFLWAAFVATGVGVDQ